MKNIDDCNEWFVGEKGASSSEAGEELVYDHDLTWGDVARASGVGETTRKISRLKIS